MNCIAAADVFTRGALMPSGYWAWKRRVTVYGHRHVFAECFGSIPEGHEIHHSCGRRDCVNPEHLIAVSHADHMRIHRATHCKNGHPFSGINLASDPYPRCRICRDERQRRYRSTPEYRERRNAARRAAYRMTHGAPTIRTQLEGAML